MTGQAAIAIPRRRSEWPLASSFVATEQTSRRQAARIVVTSRDRSPRSARSSQPDRESRVGDRTAGQRAVIRSSSCRWLDGDPRDGRETLDGYEQGRQGPGQHSFADLLASIRRSVIRLEMPRCCPRGGRPRCDDPPGPGGIGAAARSTCGGSTPAPTSTSAPGRMSAGCRAPKRPACCCRARTAGCLATGWCGGTSSAAMAPARVATRSVPIPEPSATSRRRSRWHRTGRYRTRSTRPIRKRPAPPPCGTRSRGLPRARGAG